MEWIALLIALAVLLAVDLLIVRGRDGAMSIRAASIWSVAWIAISLVFAGVLYVAGFARAGGELSGGLPRGEVVVAGQRLRVPDRVPGVLDRGGGAAQAAHLRDHRRAGPAGDLHLRRRRGAAARVVAGVPVRRAAGLDRLAAVEAPPRARRRGAAGRGGARAPERGRGRPRLQAGGSRGRQARADGGRRGAGRNRRRRHHLRGRLGAGDPGHHRPTPTWCSPPTRSPCWACGRCSSSWPTWSSACTTSRPRWPSC